MESQEVKSESPPEGPTRRQKMSTYIIITLISLMGGIEYAVILPTLYLRLDQTYHAGSNFLGLVLSAFSFSGLFAAPIMGRLYDKTGKALIIISFTNLFEFAGSIMYWLGLNKWFLLSSRLVAGLGNGFFSVVLAEVTYGTSATQRTSVVSGIMAARQFGLLLGPGFNLFLRETNFYIGDYIVDKFTAPGIFMALLWFIIQIMLMFMYYPLRPKNTKTNQLKSSAVENNQSADGDLRINESLETSQQISQKPPPLKKAVNALIYEEIVLCLLLTFISMFNQTCIETLSTPLCNTYIGWGELEISLMYCVAGVVLISSFLGVHFASKRFKDRTLIIFGLFGNILSVAWMLYWLPRLNIAHEERLKNGVVLMVGVFVLISTIPFLFVCHVSLFSKLLQPNVQGFGQGIRRVFGGIACILGPNWAGSLLPHPYIMTGVMLSLSVLALLLVLLSYNKLIYDTTAQSIPEENHNNDITEKTPLLT